jgi:hypothetical protein
MDRFATNVLAFLQSYDLDGAELEWASLTAEDISNYATLIQTLFDTLSPANKTLLLSVLPSEVYLGLPYYLLSPFLEMINFQAFQFSGDEVLGAIPYVESPLFSCLEATGLSINTMLDRVRGRSGHYRSLSAFPLCRARLLALAHAPLPSGLTRKPPHPMQTAQVLAAGAPPASVTLVAPSFARSYVLDGEGFVGGPGTPGPCMGAEGLLDQSEIALLVGRAPKPMLLPGRTCLDARSHGNGMAVQHVCDRCRPPLPSWIWRPWPTPRPSAPTSGRTSTTPSRSPARRVRGRGCGGSLALLRGSCARIWPYALYTALPPLCVAGCSPQYCFARAHCLGGLGLWDLDSDTYGDLLGTLTSAMSGDPAICEDYRTPACTNTGASVP